MAKVLVVDDDPKARMLVATILDTMPAVEVVEAENGADGLSLAQECAPDVILLDMMMPVIDGMDFLKQHAASESLSAIPVIVITALAERERVVAALASGARDYILKPFDAPRLRSKVAALLEERAVHRDVAAGGAANGSRQERPLVLVASGIDTVRRFAAETLKGSYEVIEAGDGARCLHMVAEHRPALVLLSSRIPLVPCGKVAQKIRETEEIGQTPVALLACAEEVERLDGALAALFVGTLTVPFTAKTLQTTVDRMLGRAHYYFYDRGDVLVLRFQPRGLEGACEALETFETQVRAELLTMFNTGRRRLVVDLRSIDVDETSRFKPLKQVLTEAGSQEVEVLFEASSPQVFDELRSLGVDADDIALKEPEGAGTPR